MSEPTVVSPLTAPRGGARRSKGCVIAVFAVVVFLVAGVLGRALLMKRFVMEAFKVPSASMAPTIMPGDHVMVAKSGYHPRRGDVIVFEEVSNPSLKLIKRVIGMPGDAVSWKPDGTITVNGRALKRGATTPCSPALAAIVFHTPCNVVAEERWAVVEGGYVPTGGSQATVPPASVFVVGDNRDNSVDSREFGAVPDDHVVGRVTVVWLRNGRPRWTSLK